MDVTQQRISRDGPEIRAVESGTVSFSHRSHVFDLELAYLRCFESHEMVREMIRIFLDEGDDLFAQMRAALSKSDLEEVGRLGHRLKGSVVYLGANAASEAALGVERFATSSGGTRADAEAAVAALERECRALKTALRDHSSTTNAIE